MDQKVYEIPKFKPPNISLSTVAGLVALALVGVALFSSVYKIDPEQVGVVVRFGKYQYETPAGPPLQAALHRQRHTRSRSAATQAGVRFSHSRGQRFGLATAEFPTSRPC